MGECRNWIKQKTEERKLKRPTIIEHTEIMTKLCTRYILCTGLYKNIGMPCRNIDHNPINLPVQRCVEIIKAILAEPDHTREEMEKRWSVERKLQLLPDTTRLPIKFAFIYTMRAYLIIIHYFHGWHINVLKPYEASNKNLRLLSVAFGFMLNVGEPHLTENINKLYSEMMQPAQVIRAYRCKIMTKEEYDTGEWKSLMEKYGCLPEISLACKACNCSEFDHPLRLCAGCRIIRYCSSTCQINDWPRHKSNCGNTEARAVRIKSVKVTTDVD